MRSVIPLPRGDHLPLRAAWSSLLCVSLEVLTTPTRRYHGRTSIRHFSPACAQVRDPRGPAAACWRPAGYHLLLRRVFSAILFEPILIRSISSVFVSLFENAFVKVSFFSEMSTSFRFRSGLHQFPGCTFHVACIAASRTPARLSQVARCVQMLGTSLRVLRVEKIPHVVLWVHEIPLYNL